MLAVTVMTSAWSVYSVQPDEPFLACRDRKAAALVPYVARKLEVMNLLEAVARETLEEKAGLLRLGAAQGLDQPEKTQSWALSLERQAASLVPVPKALTDIPTIHQARAHFRFQYDVPRVELMEAAAARVEVVKSEDWESENLEHMAVLKTREVEARWMLSLVLTERTDLLALQQRLAAACE